MLRHDLHHHIDENRLVLCGKAHLQIALPNHPAPITLESRHQMWCDTQKIIRRDVPKASQDERTPWDYGIRVHQ